MKTTRAVANFDSASVMLGALAAALRGETFPGLGTLPTIGPAAALVNALPRPVREAIYLWGGWREGVPPDRVGRVRSEEIARWVVAQYPARRYPAVAIGSASGGAVHLCAALGIPWLPQTVLIPVRRRSLHPDEARHALAAGVPPGRALLAANPDLQLHHMHDPNHDRLMIRRMAHFRAKRLRLGPTYERFLAERLAPGGTIVTIECEASWPATRVGDRHFFQFGGLGGAPPDEYLGGGPRVGTFLHHQRSPRARWDPPPPDSTNPEAEWGFAPQLLADITRVARRDGYTVRRVRFAQPEDLSAPVADLYRRWLRQRGLPADRLLVESFVLLDPGWTLRAGAVPFWALFGDEPSADRVAAYLDADEPFAEILLALNSHGVDSVGLAGIERWRSLLRRATRHGRFVGVDERAYPRDFGTFVRFGRDLRRLPAPYPPPPPLSLAELDAFIAEAGSRWDSVRSEEMPLG